MNDQRLPVPQRVVASAALAERLIVAQFPDWARLPVHPVPVNGWDNTTFRLGEELLIRLPTAAEYALAVEKEQFWLPRLASALPLRIPVPRATGVASADFEHPWSIYEWLPGETLASCLAAAQCGKTVVEPNALAGDLSGFLIALQRFDAREGPQPGIHNWYRGAPLSTYRSSAAGAIDALSGEIDGNRARRLMGEALESEYRGVDRWLHGDLAAGNLLVEQGRLSAVIDFGSSGVGDPACDYAAAWTLLEPDGRELFRELLGVGDADWARGRGWALWKTLLRAVTAKRDGDAQEWADSRRLLEAIC